MPGAARRRRGRGARRPRLVGPAPRARRRRRPAATFALFRAQGRTLADSPALGGILAQPYLAHTAIAPGTAVAAIRRRVATTWPGVGRGRRRRRTAPALRRARHGRPHRRARRRSSCTRSTCPAGCRSTRSPTSRTAQPLTLDPHRRRRGPRAQPAPGSGGGGVGDPRGGRGRGRPRHRARHQPGAVRSADRHVPGRPPPAGVGHDRLRPPSTPSSARRCCCSTPRRRTTARS